MSRLDANLSARMHRVAEEVAAIQEHLDTALYDHIEGETLKQAAIDAGVDHTRESSVVLIEIMAALQHERDVNRELRRRVTALERDARGTQPEPGETP